MALSKHPDHALQQITSHHTGKKEIINKRNQCAFSVNRGTPVWEGATWMLTAWDDLYYTNENQEMCVIIK